LKLSQQKFVPRVGHVPRRWKVCADAALNSRAAARPIEAEAFMISDLWGEKKRKNLDDTRIKILL
jgi:hypothetical protein